jgi:hypothetical protein
MTEDKKKAQDQKIVDKKKDELSEQELEQAAGGVHRYQPQFIKSKGATHKEVAKK